MSRRSKPAAASRRTRRAGEPAPPLPVFAGSSGVMATTNPIFHREAGPVAQPSPPLADRDQLRRCVHGPGSVRVLVRDPAMGAARGGAGKPLPPPPCRARVSGVRVGPAVVVGGPRGRGRRMAAQDPFLAAYVVCSMGGGGGGGGHVKRPEEEKTMATTGKKGKGGDGVRGCGVWNGWAYAGGMSCRSGRAVDALAADAPAAAAAAKAKAAAESEVPTLDLSWAPAVLSARSLERRREQR
ncbi:hypothetical protein ACP4OV_026559 [Aristida adscensionis]